MSLLLTPLARAPLPGLATRWPPAIPSGGWQGTPFVTINGVGVLVEGVPPIQDIIGQRGQVQLTVINTPGARQLGIVQTALTIREGHTVVITDAASGNTIWSGFVASAKQTRTSYAPPTYSWDVQCVDNVSLADRRIAAGAWQNVTCGYIVRQLLNNYLGAEGCSAANIQDGPTLTQYIINYEPVSQHLDALAKLAGFYWNIDAYRALTFAAYSTAPAPYTFDGSQADDPDGNSLMSVQHTSPLYRNGQYLLGITEVTSPQTETRQGDGKTAAFLMSYPVYSVSAITLNGTAQTVGVQGKDTGKQWYYSVGNNAITQDSSGTKLLNTDTLAVTYIGQYPTLVFSDDSGAQTTWQALEGNTTSGQVEQATTDTTIVSSAQGFQSAAALLAKYATSGDILTFRSLTGGLQSGMLLPVALTDINWGLTSGSDFLVQSVVASYDGFAWWYDVTALSGPVNDTWVNFFQRIAAGQGVINTTGAGQQSTVSLLETGTVAYTWSVTGNATVYTLPTPSSTLFPSSTLYPGTAGAPVAITWTKTNVGLRALRDVLSGAGSSLTVGYLAWGTGTQGSPSTATQLAAEVGRKAVASIANGAAAGEDIINGYLGPQDANGTAITEVAFFAGPSAGTGANSGTMLLYGLWSHTKSGLEAVTVQADSTIS